VADLESAFDDATRAKAQAAVFITDNLLFGHRKEIAEIALAHHLPTIHAFPAEVQDGGLMSLIRGKLPARGGAGRQDHQGCAPRRPAGRAANQVRTGHQPQNRQGARPCNPRDISAACRRGNRE
jgi:hypothetical protein